MALKSGFYDSIEGDRTYNANDLNNIYAGVRSDGVVAGVSNNFRIVAGSGMSVDVTPGLAIIRNKWCSNSAGVNLKLDAGGTLARIDGIYLKSDETEREIVPVVVKGTESSSPVKPNPSNNPNTKYLPLAYVTIPAGATSGGFTIEDARTYSGINSAPRVVLWENPNPTAEFASQTIVLAESVDLFDTICVELRNGQKMIGKGGQFQQLSSYGGPDHNAYTYFSAFMRDYTSSGTNFTFSNCKNFNLMVNDGALSRPDNEAAGTVVNKNNMLIPYRVYGVNRK